ncbi:hypothetical protein Btru_073752 [Bulinus truncatus]|nr:hypothetical protein Btru_073752 [Bulinus truncatus]
MPRRKKQKVTDYSTELSRGQVKINHPHEFHLRGVHEMQVSEGGEADLHKHFNDCQKNPGHENFISYEKFSLDDIPESHRDPDLFEFIKVVADLTVRLAVKKISADRLQFWPDTDVPYPFYKGGKSDLSECDLSIDGDSPRYGSGQINEVIQFFQGIGKDRHGKERSRDYKTCICKQCLNSENPSKVWWEIVVRTATHVVFNEEEASHTSCRLFFDSQKSKLVKIDDMKLLEVNIVQDWCLISYVFCGNLEYRDALLNKVSQRVDLWKKVCQKFQKSEPSPAKLDDEDLFKSVTSHEEKYSKANKFQIKKWSPGDNLTFIVSHPHGSSKYISFGFCERSYLLGQFDKDLDLTKLIYTTPTCPGSSGAAVRCVGLGVGHVHSGTLPDDTDNYDEILPKGWNYSGVSLVYREGSPYVWDQRMRINSKQS